MMAWRIALVMMTLGIAAPADAQDDPQGPESEPEESTEAGADAAGGELAAREEEARAMFARGRELFDRRNYALALEAFERSYALLEGSETQPLLLYNLALCRDELGQYERAAELYTRFLAEAPDDTERRDVARTRLAELRQRAADAEPAVDAGAEEEPASASSHTDLTPFAVAAFSAGGLGALTWAIAGGLVAARDAELSPGCYSAGTCSAGELETQDALAVVADVGFALTLAGAAVGVVLLLLDGEGDEDGASEGASLAPWIHRDGGGLFARARW